MIEELLIALFSRGHCILEGVPGLAKTLMLASLATCCRFRLYFSRIQFTPDLMPADITGTEVIEENRRPVLASSRSFGPLFANIVLADEINSTHRRPRRPCSKRCKSVRCHSRSVRHRLQSPFFVLATKNPIEQEGTYPLPEAQQDRFMFKVFVRYPASTRNGDRTTHDGSGTGRPVPADR